ncbi:MAG: LemA family protein [Pseudomonadota bacterium]
MSVIFAGVGLIVVIGAIFVVLYNGLVSKRQTVNQSFADIDVQLKQRQNLIPNLIETVKGYASHEKETLDQVVAARNSAIKANNVNDVAAAEEALTGALGKLFALAEAYPDLKANTNFLQLQDELSAIEDKLAAARRFFNSAVQDYNTATEQFPGVLVANWFNFERRDFFDVGDDRTALSSVPKVDF